MKAVVQKSNDRFSAVAGGRRSRWTRAGILLLVGCSLNVAHAEPKTADWYQVEVTIFERLPGNQAGDTESWPKDVDLHYPADWQKLITQETAADLLAQLEPVADLSEESTEDFLAPESQTNPPAMEPGTLVIDETAPQPPAPPLRYFGAEPEFAFVKLPEAERTLNETTGGISRDRTLRVLFHEAWRQPILARDKATSIIIRGGNEYQNHRELEGSIRLNISRYLHVYTNLWLTEFVPNYGQEPEHWPLLPPVPQHDTPQATDNVFDAELVADDRPFDFSDSQSSWKIEAPVAEDYSSLIEQPFLIDEIVTLSQSRRMRSGELHYIDHPRLGVIIKVDIYSPDSDE